MMVKVELPHGSGEVWVCHEGFIEHKFQLKPGEPIGVEVKEGRFIQLRLDKK